MDEGAFFDLLLGFKPYAYQLAVLKDKSKQIAVRAGRQVGKTTVLAMRTLYDALENKDWEIILVAPVFRQSTYLFQKIKEVLAKHPEISRTKESAKDVFFSNGSKIYCLPAGSGLDAGDRIRGFSPQEIVVDEADMIPENTWVVLEPSLIRTGGKLILSSTPKRNIGRFYEAFKDPSFSTYHIPATECPDIKPEYIERQKELLSAEDFKREILGEFVEEEDNFFPKKLIDLCLEDIPETNAPLPEHSYKLAVDCARYGSDETIYIIGDFIGTMVRVTKITFTAKKPATDIIDKVKLMHEIFNFDFIYLDETGVGGGVADELLAQGLPLIPVSFHFRIKAELYNNLRTCMEMGLVKFSKLHEKLIIQLSQLRYKQLREGLQIITPPRKHDDYTDALALLCKDLRKGTEEEKDFYMR